MDYAKEMYTDGSKNEKGVESGVAIFVKGSLSLQLRYKLAEKCSSNQAKLVILKSLTELRDMHKVQGCQRTTAIDTDSGITLEAIADRRNRNNLVELIKDEMKIRR